MKYLPVTVRGLPSGTTARQVEDNFNGHLNIESPCLVGPIVEELQGGSCSTTVIFQKEKKGRKRSCEDIKDSFHLSRFESGSTQATISISDDFLGLNALAGRRDAPIHLGGIVALNMALLGAVEGSSRREYHDLFVHNDRCLVKGVVLLGTPLRGSGQANLMAPIVKTVKGLNRLYGTNENFVRALREDSGALDIPQIVTRFKSVVKTNGVALRIVCEERPVVGSSLTTSYDSALAILGDIVTPFRIQGRDHISMVKFQDENDTEYKKLENLIIKMIRPLVPTRPGGEDHHFSSTDRSTGASSDQPPWQQGSNSFTPWRQEPNPINFNVYLAAQSNAFASPSRQQTYPTQSRPPPSPAVQTVSDPTMDGSSIPAGTNQDSLISRAQTDPHPDTTADENPFNRLDLFDTAFIIDDTGSMVKEARNDEPNGLNRWAVTVQALDHIAEIAAQHDPDGIDIRFLKSAHLADDNIRSGKAVKKKLDQIDLWDGKHGGGTYFQERLEELIDPRVWEYQWFKEDLAKYPGELRQATQKRLPRSQWPKKPTQPSRYNVIVVTDGAADDRQEVEEYIISVATRLDELRAPKRQIGIQFVQVGEDESAKVWLKRLDDDLSNMVPPIRDIVDTTPFDSHLIQENASFAEALEQVIVSNVLQKALLGAVTEEEDNRVIEAGMSELGV
ncbi:uncharacterized protein KY384_001137 [Bacidia gigantensis]|uniref:uncharacterized protein n=1 Tax=Bacidia gigantensis TaxID=2732470 RepID=UPI001D0492D6|nr:uncharacterized protein KY384_001137 [Bacidia gigantensis]KAG8534293.1 hypothetical protein KY384_001137 [Bacidia gigantensis]